ncbi:TetR/AcrR family transcriptional regulator, partial [Rhizobiaceae sp. 2RAB30]
LPEAQRVELHKMERRIVKAFSDVLSEINPELGKGQAGVTPVTMSLFGILNWAYTWFKPSGALSRDGYADMVTALILGGVTSLNG